jgi:hypothetical protein
MVLQVHLFFAFSKATFIMQTEDELCIPNTLVILSFDIFASAFPPIVLELHADLAV